MKYEKRRRRRKHKKAKKRIKFIFCFPWEDYIKPQSERETRKNCMLLFVAHIVVADKKFTRSKCQSMKWNWTRNGDMSMQEWTNKFALVRRTKCDFRRHCRRRRHHLQRRYRSRYRYTTPNFCSCMRYLFIAIDLNRPSSSFYYHSFSLVPICVRSCCYCWDVFDVVVVFVDVIIICYFNARHSTAAHIHAI